MNVFEDLISELKEENLLEQTVIDPADGAGEEHFAPEEDAEARFQMTQASGQPVSDEARQEEFSGVEGFETFPTEFDDDRAVPAKPSNGKEFYKKRAVGEISNLQMVEHVLTGVEREFLKIVPRTFDDFNAKKALHAFLQVDEGENSAEHAEAEFEMMQETEAWCTALAKRDVEISVASIRSFCENSRPPLSSQALIALARFYRNLPYSEAVRSKFDFIITRLFSRGDNHDKRIALFTRDETLTHVEMLYREWSSVPLYSAEEEEANVLLAALSFDDLAVEADNAARFDDLIESDFFGRVRSFKESINELFYAPVVTAAAIECNIRIGNAYVTLIDAEKNNADGDDIRTKYGVLDDQISEAAARTIELQKLLARHDDAEEEESELDQGYPAVIEASTPEPNVPASQNAEHESSGFVHSILSRIKGKNKWFLSVAAIFLAATIVASVWGTAFINDEVSTQGVRTLNVEDSSLKEHLKMARISGENYYGVLEPSWDQISKEKRQEFLLKVYQSAREQGCTQVTLLSADGKVAGFASPARVEITSP